MESGNELIFISIASYRDSQLVPTVVDLLMKADAPELLRFGICWQHGPEETALPFAEDSRFQVIDVPWQQSRGACWARAEIMKLWRGEQWFLQVDSHCRFASRWDTSLIRMMSQTGSSKPILSTYGNGFVPADEASETKEALEGPPHMIAIETFTDGGIPQLKPLGIPDFDDRTRPMAGRFLGAGFIFAPGSFVEEVPYDPELYFFGEEVSMSLRAYTSGYDLFHPVETVVWHDYVRAYATRHWDDHDPAKVDPITKLPLTKAPAWADLDVRSRAKVRSLFAAATLGEVAGSSLDQPLAGERFGLGSARTLADYEAYAGMSFRLRKIQDYTRRGLEPPNPPAPADWPDRIYTWLVRIAIDTAELSPCAFDPSGFWVVAIMDEDRTEIRRHDAGKAELQSVNRDEPQVVLINEIQSGIVPAFWSVWPYSRENGWGQKLEGRFAPSDYAIITEDEDQVSAEGKGARN